MYPKELMAGVYWRFLGGKYESQTEFVRNVTEFNKEFRKNKWNSNETVLKSSKVSILYSYWDYDIDEEIEEVFELEANNKTGFTAGELLYKVHNQVIDKLENEVHQSFEGFLLGENESHQVLESLLLGEQTYNINHNQPFYFIKQWY